MFEILRKKKVLLHHMLLPADVVDLVGGAAKALMPRPLKWFWTCGYRRKWEDQQWVVTIIYNVVVSVASVTGGLYTR